MEIEELYPFSYIGDKVSEDECREIDNILNGTGMWEIESPIQLLTIRGNDAKLLLKAVDKTYDISSNFTKEEWKKIEDNPEKFFKE